MMHQVVVIGSITDQELMLIEESLGQYGYQVMVKKIDISPIASCEGRFFLSENAELLLEVMYSKDYELGDEIPIFETSELVSRWLRDEYKDVERPLCLIYKTTDFLFPELDICLLPGILKAWNTKIINLCEHKLA